MEENTFKEMQARIEELESKQADLTDKVYNLTDLLDNLGRNVKDILVLTDTITKRISRPPYYDPY